jgi:hypothetical protein
MATIYEINKGINRSVEFRGIKAQYIMYLAGGLIGLLLLFTILYIIGFGIYLCLGIIIPSGTVLFVVVQRYSKIYGEHGLTRKKTNARMPQSIISYSRKLFIQLTVNDYEYKKINRRSTSYL